MTRATQMEVETRKMVEAVGLDMVRSETKRMARATFDLKLGDRTLAQGLIVAEIVAVVTVLTELNNTDEGDAPVAEAAADPEAEITATEDAAEQMPTEA